MSLDFFPFCDKISTIWKDIAETKRKRSPSARGKRCKPPDELPQAISRVARDDRDGRIALLAEKQKLSEEVRRMKQELRRPDEGPG